MASHSSARAWLPIRRVGEDVLQLRDGSLRALFEVEPAPARALAALSALGHPVQIVLRAKRADETDERPWRRLRASHAILMSSLTAGRPALAQRVLLTVPWDASEGGDGATVLDRRVQEVSTRLDRAGLDPVRIVAAELDTVAALDIVHEGRCEVHAAGRLARSLVLTRLSDPLVGDPLEALDCEHDVSIHARPASRPGRLELAAYATLWASNRGALDAATEQAEALLAAQGMRARRPYLQAEPALLSTQPLCLDLAGAARVVPAGMTTCDAARSGDRRLLYGADPGTRQPLRLDRFALANTSALVVGSVEDRRRVLLLELLRARLADVDVHVVDGTGAYASMVAALDGCVITPASFDAFSVSDEGLETRLRMLLALIELVAGDLDSDVRAAVQDALAYVYAAHGYMLDGEHSGCEPPALAEIVATLERRSAGAPDAVRALVARLKRFAAGPGRRLVAQRSSPPRLGRFSLHDLAGLAGDDRPPAALLSIDRLRRERARGRRSLLLLDGVDELLTGDASQVTASFGPPVGLTVGTDDVPAVLSGPMLAAGLKVLLRQEPATAERLGEALRLTPAEQLWLVRAAPDEGLLVTHDRRLAFRAVASNEEERLITGVTG